MSQKPPAPNREPFVGPRSFLPGEKLYGRDREIEELKDRLLASHVVLLHALSGAGKTSLIQAGLSPRLSEDEDFLVLPVARVNLLPDTSQLTARERKKVNRYQVSVLLSIEDELVRQKKLAETDKLPLPELAGMSLKRYLELRAAKLAVSDPPDRMLLILDQFEEVLTLNPGDQADKEDFFAWLMPALYDVRVWVLFSMRDDFIGGLEPYLDYIPDRLSMRYRLEFLSTENALEAITRPTVEFGVTFQKRAARKLVDNLRTVTIPDLDSQREEKGLYVEPIQLQVVCLKLWRIRAPGARTIGVEDVEKSGNVDEALGDYYNEVLERTCGENLRLERSLRDWIQRQLIIDDTFRFQSHLRHLARFGLEIDPVRHLVNAYLVRPEQRQGTTVYELTHDRLVRPIVESNRRWRERNLKPWQNAAERWDREERPAISDLLLKSGALKAARDDYNAALGSAVDLAFLEASEKAIQQVQQGEQRRLADPERLLRVQLGTNLDEVGWGIIFDQDANPNLIAALSELLEHRRAQAGRSRDSFFHIFSGLNGYRSGESADDFLLRNGDTGGPTNPEKVPYYLLIVGDPQTIPFQFQYDLDQRYAVGRIFFPDPVQYQRYARSVRVCEGGTVTLPNTAAVFSTRFPDDPETKTFTEAFTEPLYEMVERSQPNWQVRLVSGDDATRAGLSGLLGGPDTPALLIAASWGAGTPYAPSRPEDVGALLTRDWSGPAGWEGPVRPEHYFSAQDIEDDEARLLGMMVMLTGSYTAGAPRVSDYAFLDRTAGQAESTGADLPTGRALLAELPQRLLSHPRGGALGVIAHVDQVWTSSLTNVKGESDVEGIYLGLLARLMQGYTSGAAMELLNLRRQREFTEANRQLQEAFFTTRLPGRRQLQNVFIRAIDARNYILIGDPAARLPLTPSTTFQQPESGWTRPEIQPVTPLVSSATKAPVEETGLAAPVSELWYAGGVLLAGEYAEAGRTVEDMLELFRQMGRADELKAAREMRFVKR